MSSLDTRLASQERKKAASLNGSNPRNCGRGLKLPKGHPILCCSVHNTQCWMRHNPVTWAKALIIVEAAEVKDYEAMDAEPTPAQVEEARQMLLAQGYELEEGWNE